MATPVDFYFDVLCPFAWRTSLWIRSIASERMLAITWKPFSLVLANDPELSGEWAADGMGLGRTFVLAERDCGNEAVDRLYLALGDAIHGRELNPFEEPVMQAALIKAGLPANLSENALNDPTTDQAYRAAHEAALARDVFGVPTLFIDGSGAGYFGPVVDPVPRGQAALELWDYTAWAARQPYFWELKRERTGRLAPQPADLDTRITAA